METTYLWIATAVVAIVAIYFLWVRKLGTGGTQPQSSADHDG